MILADTSVWIDHFRRGEPRLAAALMEGEVVIHPFVIGELALGNFRNRRAAIELLTQLPRASVATHEEVMAMIDDRGLMGRGIGYTDAHLLAGVLLSPGALLWTKDHSLAQVAARLSVAAGS